MKNFQAEKAVVRAHHEALFKAGPDSVADALSERTAPDWHWRGMHPFHEQSGAEAVAAAFWGPFLTAMTGAQHRPDIFMAGENHIDGNQSVWVTSMGHFMGLFDRPFLGIRPTGKIVMLRYAEFNKVEDGRITETALFVDIPHLMMQAGQNPFPPQTGAHLVQPGPATHEGLMYGAQDPATGQESLRAINTMLTVRFDDDTDTPYPEKLARTWHDDMIWWGPAGIGASYTIPGYMRQHATPFGEALTEGYQFNGHLCRLAEGNFGGFFGWPNLTLTNSGGFMGMTASPHPADMRVVDIYRVEDGKLAENWIFIDILHYLNMQGLDILGRMESLCHTNDT
ncbi:nuclear transport factor 2 family protein [Paenarthrobacter sp. OM7]|uniref:nuclear transport factor 2 family protein n=1 Tax=Paenarthrobacter sp. OM7 TaxID=3041264 RepID=UPI002468F8A8|nr:nuclear transport factor 2 family protein [Paenarthrobacter sp. OM7]WGM20482.1 nuclear transport factor 2 family protein [Paenarthrobacter sp. OM7]